MLPTTHLRRKVGLSGPNFLLNLHHLWIPSMPSGHELIIELQSRLSILLCKRNDTVLQSTNTIHKLNTLKQKIPVLRIHQNNSNFCTKTISPHFHGQAAIRIFPLHTLCAFHRSKMLRSNFSAVVFRFKGV